MIPAATCDVAGIVAAVKAHHWPNHPDSPMPFGSVDECRDALRPFLRVRAA